MKKYVKLVISKNVEWIRLAEDWDSWLAAVNRIVNMQVP